MARTVQHWIAAHADRGDASISQANRNIPLQSLNYGSPCSPCNSQPHSTRPLSQALEPTWDTMKREHFLVGVSLTPFPSGTMFLLSPRFILIEYWTIICYAIWDIVDIVETS